MVEAVSDQIELTLDVPPDAVVTMQEAGYTKGYDGHSLRAYAYYHTQMPDINPASVDSINSIKHRYEDLRSKSKTPTFALTYDGTWRTLMKNCGFTEEEAKMVEASFNKLYIVSIMWVAERLKEASRVGYITAAFGLRVRTPVLKQVVMGTCNTPREAEAEGRSAGNALGQSWCLLNNRAANEFAEINMSNAFMRENIRPCAHIHHWWI